MAETRRKAGRWEKPFHIKFAVDVPSAEAVHVLKLLANLGFNKVILRARNHEQQCSKGRQRHKGGIVYGYNDPENNNETECFNTTR